LLNNAAKVLTFYHPAWVSYIILLHQQSYFQICINILLFYFGKTSSIKIVLQYNWSNLSLAPHESDLIQFHLSDDGWNLTPATLKTHIRMKRGALMRRRASATSLLSHRKRINSPKTSHTSLCSQSCLCHANSRLAYMQRDMQWSCIFSA